MLSYYRWHNRDPQEDGYPRWDNHLVEDYSVSSLTKGGRIYYHIRWSHFIALDKRLVRTQIPAVAGVFQLYIIKGGALDYLSVHQAYYGGIRGTLMEILDDDCPVDFPKRDFIRENKVYIRYSVDSRMNELRDILHHFTGSESSGRFNEILVEESETMKISR